MNLKNEIRGLHSSDFNPRFKDSFMSKVDDLDAQIAELQAKKAEAIKNEKKSQLSSIKSLLRKYKVTFAEIEKSLSPGKGYEAKKIYPNSGYFDFEDVQTEDDIIDECKAIDEFVNDQLLMYLDDDDRATVDPDFKKAYDACPYYDIEAVKNEFFSNEDDPHEDDVSEKQFEALSEYYIEKEIEWSEFLMGRLSIDNYKKLKR